MASVNCFVEALPPRSPVIVFPSAIVCRQETGEWAEGREGRILTDKVACSILRACSFRFMCLVGGKILLFYSENKDRSPEHHDGGKKESRGICKALASNIRSRSMDGFKDRGVL